MGADSLNSDRNEAPIVFRDIKCVVPLQFPVTHGAVTNDIVLIIIALIMNVNITIDSAQVDSDRIEAPLVFRDIKCLVPLQFTATLCRRRQTDHGNRMILKGVSGALRPGRLTFILGPSGAGKTTLLNILSGRKCHDGHGNLVGTRKDTVLVKQDATLLDALTARETLLFAASLKMPYYTQGQRLVVVNNVAEQLGLTEVIRTRAGQLSGGERKRLVIAAELLTDPDVLLLDEPTSGLDSVSAMSVIKAIHQVAYNRQGRIVACVVHQPASRLYGAADDVILLADGKTLYAGPVVEVPDGLRQAGFVCPTYYNVADFLIEVATRDHVGDIMHLQNQANKYTSDMEKIAVNKTSDNAVFRNSNYKASLFEQIRALLWRSNLVAIRDKHLMHIRLACHLLVALLLGALYYGGGNDANRVLSNTACLFFFLLFLFFANAMPTINTFPAEANVVLREHLNKWYSLPAYCITKLIVDVPFQVLCATAFFFPAWFLTGQLSDPFRLLMSWTICLLITTLAQTFGLVVGAACDIKLGMFVVPAANIPMLMFSTFFIPYSDIPYYLRPLANISYFKYAFDGIMQIAYGFNRPKLQCNFYCVFKNPADYLDFLDINGIFNINLYVISAWIVFLQISLYCVLRFRVWRCKQ